jgi:Tfp pilus assembly protein FimT
MRSGWPLVPTHRSGLRLLGRSSAGLTLVETLIVLASFSLLVQLMLPAIQGSREAARRTQCLQNLRQLSIACALHEGAPRTVWQKGIPLTCIPR